MAFPDGPDSVAGRDHRPVAAKTHSRQDAHHPDNARNAGQSSRWGRSHRHRRATAQRNRIRLFVRNHVQGALSASTRVRYRPQLGPTDARHRPDLLQPTPAIDRTSLPADARYRPDLLPADLRYRPDLLQPTPVIDRTPCSRPALSTGPPPTDARYRPDLLQPTPVIDRTPFSRPALSTGPPSADPRYRPDPLQPTRVIDRTSSSRPSISTGPPSADPRYRPDLLQPTLVIDRTSSSRPSISTGPPPTDARYRPDLLSFAMSLRQSRHACATSRPTASASARRARTTGFPVARRTACSSGPL